MRYLAIGLAGVLALAAAPAFAGPFGASADVDNTITVSGSWTSVQWYEADGCYSGVGDPTVSDWDSQAQGNTPINLSTTASDSQGSAYSAISVFAGPPTIDIESGAQVHDVQPGPGGEVDYHWAFGYSQGGANWLTSGATQTVDVTVEYDIVLDPAEYGAAETEVFAKIYVAFWDGQNQPTGPNDLLLTEDAEWVRENSGVPNTSDYLVRTVVLDTAGGVTKHFTGSKTWQVDVTSGSYYSFWGQADASAWTVAVPEPATMLLAGLGTAALLLGRRRKR
jgi:hypothetical protein